MEQREAFGAACCAEWSESGTVERATATCCRNAQIQKKEELL